MTDESPLVEALLMAGTVALLFVVVFLVAYRVVTWARRQSKKGYVIGALVSLLPFHVVDPDFRIVNEAKQLKKREEDNPGDPPTDADDSVAPEAVQMSNEPEHGDSQAEVAIAAKPRVARSILARAIALLLSLMAVATLIVASLALFSDVYGADVRQSFSAFEWTSIYLASALLLASMVQLFRLRRASVWLFAAYLELGVLFALFHWLLQGPNPYLDLRILFVTVPMALIVLAYMRQLRTQGALV